MALLPLRLLISSSLRYATSQLSVTLALAAFSQKGMMVVDAERTGETSGGQGSRWEGTSHVITAEALPVSEQTFETNLLNLLIVEDERSVRECCREVARSLGFSVQVAESREEAYRIL